ncbi:MAG TPA: hypothetical protein VGJ15_13650, partial [Pirellulales bacterium]
LQFARKNFSLTKPRSFVPRFAATAAYMPSNLDFTVYKTGGSFVRFCSAIDCFCLIKDGNRRGNQRFC